MPPVSGGWLEVIDDTQRFAQLRADWDGEGAKPVPHALIRSAVGLFELLRQDGRAVPDGVYPLPSGAIMIEWHNEDGTRLSAEIRQPGQAELMHWQPSGQAEFHTVHFSEPNVSTPLSAGQLEVGLGIATFSWPRSH
jgi:hypothetical protein